MLLFSLNSVSKIFKSTERVGRFIKFPKLKIIKGLDNVSFSINHGEHVAIVGANGSGKSTLVNIMTGLYKCSYGSVYFNDQLVKDTTHMKDISLCLANGYGLIPSMKAIDFLKLKCKLAGRIFDESNQFVDMLQLKNILDKQIIKCSSGEQQRVNLAGNVIVDNDIYIFDEPTNSLDVRNKYIFINILEKLRALNKTIILISHHTDEIVLMDRIIVLSDGIVSDDMPMIKDKPQLDSFLYQRCNIEEKGKV